MKTSFSSAEISDVEWKDYIDNYNKEHPDDGLNYDGTSGGSICPDIKATEAASEKDSDSTSKSAVSTADESPIGTMSVLTTFSARRRPMCWKKRKRRYLIELLSISDRICP